MEKDIFYLRPEQKTFCIDKDFEVYNVRVCRYVDGKLDSVLIDDNDCMYDCDFMSVDDLLPGFRLFHKVTTNLSDEYFINGIRLESELKRAYPNACEEKIAEYVNDVVLAASKLGCPIV